jgi:nucleoside-diphosphate-sugar epimerase
MAFLYIVIGVLSLLITYLWHVERGMSGTPPDAAKLPREYWTPKDVRIGYEKTRSSPTNVSEHLPPKLGRRYIVVGGSGLVGGSIVQHLLLRGEDSEAIRILDLREPTQSLILESKVRFIKTDVTSSESVNEAFAAAWPSSRVAKLPLTIFHTVAYINPSERKQDFMAIYQAVNVDGTRHVLEAAKGAGATCLVATASGTVGMKPPSYFISPFTRWSKNALQILSEPEPFNANLPISGYNSCYSYSKAVAESYVLGANSPSLRTGCVRPGHAIYGAGVSNVSSISWSYLSRGGSPTWLFGMVTNFVNAQNVSIAHLAFEASILSDKDVSGRTYYVTDPGLPVYYGDLYTVLNTLAHKDTPTNFPKIPAVPVLLIGYIIETYMLVRARYLHGLPPITGDIAMMTPAIFNMSTVHVVYDNRLAMEEIGYRPPISTMEGLCLQMLEWNGKVDQRIIKKGGMGPRESKIQTHGGSVSVNVPVVAEVNKT